jgi:hypothetical protein
MDIKKTKRDGSPYRCKFCRGIVWLDDWKKRYVDPDTTTQHHCPNRQAYYKNEAMERAESSRQKRER